MYRTRTMLILIVLTFAFGIGLSAAAIHSVGRPDLVWQSSVNQER